MKTCPKCGIEKQDSEFYMNGGRPSGRCKPCVKAYQATPERRASMRSAISRYHKSPKGRAAKRRYEQTENGRQKRLEHASAHARRHPDKYRARQTAAYAVRSGKIPKLPCAVCGSTEVHAHHHDYSKPLDVTWLCKKHHGELHAQEAADRRRQGGDGPKVCRHLQVSGGGTP